MSSNQFITFCSPGKGRQAIVRWLGYTAMLLMGLLQFSQSAMAQPTISRVEYYYDTDPGYGNATNLSIAAGQTNISSATIAVNPANLSEGVHRLYVRAKSSNGWSLDNTWLFYKPYTNTGGGTGTTAPNVTRVEYFYDNDPGIGAATNLPITAGITLANLVIPVNPATLSEGVHRLYVRAKSSNGWSLTNTWLFYKPYTNTGGGTGSAPPNISRIEYYLDTDPGVGNATSLPFTAGTDLANLVIPVNQLALTEGVHRLYVRAKSSNGWGLTNTWLFYKPYTNYGGGTSTPPPNIVALEYYVDEDPGIGVATPVAINSLTDLASLPVAVNISTLAAGDHQLHVRARDANGNWSLVNTLDFTTNPGVPGNSVVVSSIDKTTFCSSETLKVSYDANGTFTGANTFKVFLSNASGSFTNEVEIGSVTTTITSGIINCSLPGNIIAGTGYKVRIKSSGPATTGPANASAITISQAAVPSVSISSNLGAGVCAGSNITFTATPTNGGVSPTYVWKVNGTDVGTGPSYQSTTLSAGDVVTAVLTSSVACVSSPTATSNTITVQFANVTPSVTIAADPGTTICAGVQVTFTATPVNGGTSPTIQWFKNSGTGSLTSLGYGISIVYNNIANGDIVTASMLSNAPCAVPTGVNSTNSLTFVVQTGVTYYQDADGDGYGNASAPLSSCAQPAGYVTNSTDCNDGNAAINPTTVWYADADNDGYSNGTNVTQCARPTGYKYAGELFATSGDCNDANAAINPGVSEVCGNGVDDNCNGQIDEACNTYTWYRDNDGDGFGDLNTTTTTTVNIAPAGYVANSTDCDDNNADINAQYSFFVDNDGDGYGVPGSILVCAEDATTPPSGYATNSTDCDDNNADIHAQYSFFRDNDGDGFGVPGSISVCAEDATTPPSGYATNSTDCDDNNSQIHAQYPFYVDNDADGYGGGNSVLICAVNAAAVPAGYSASGGDCNDANAAINPTTVWYKDTDNDGYSDGSTLTQCAQPTGYKLATNVTATSGDCNDANAAINPAATEICGNGIDENCNGLSDENCETFTWFQDLDGDGYGNPAISTNTPTNTAPAGYVSNNTDCDDANAAINPTTVWYKDADNDGYSDGSTLTQCTAPASYKLASALTTTGGDCNDANAAVHPGATEVCNGIDDNCNGSTDEGVTTTYYRDADSDGYGNQAVTTQSCSAPTGYVSNNADCDDASAAINPTTVWFKDADGDGYSDGSTLTQCAIPTGYQIDTALTATSGDCNDANAAINPGATEICGNGIDENCNGQVDENCETFTWFRDADGDGYGNPSASTTTPTNTAPAGYVANNLDCNDASARINPTTVWFKDADGDGYSDGSTLTQCAIPTGYQIDTALTATSGDCNDANAAINPGATEICGNGIDENCNGQVDENCETFTWFRDADGDGYGNPSVSTTTPTNSAPAGYVANNLDCNDASARINPTTVWFKDADGDGYSDGSTLTQCAKPTGYQIDTALTATSGDCNDANAAINPGATEICGNGVDENCNGQVDENCETFTWFQDLDGDGYGNPAVTTTTPTNIAPAGYVSNNTDCDDSNADYNPAAIWYKDVDDDGYGDGTTLVQCLPPSGYKPAAYLTALTGDCNDDDPLLNPATVWYRDIDLDGYSDGTSITQCQKPGPFGSNVYKMAGSLIATSGDCNDENPAIHPDASEVCGNGVDDNCNGQVDEECEIYTYYQDADGDGYGNPAISVTTPGGDIAPPGYVSIAGDCDDTNANINPAATEICGNNVDENCNGQIDENCQSDFTWYQDLDADGYGNPAVTTTTPTNTAPAGYVSNNADCDDNNAAINPTTVWYKDADNDGYSNGSTLTQCIQPASYKLASTLLATSGDCNDANVAINPAATEICGNGVDDNCNGQIDENCTTDPCGGVIGVLYVNAAAVTSGTGSGWACAIQQLRDAVVIANSNPSITQIWVAKGEYKTTSGTDRAATINITRAGLQILGGFAGTETSATQANPTTNVTSISGDIGVAGNKADNSFHLLRIADLPASASGLRIQGFLLEKGNANLGDPNTSENVYGGAVIVKDVNPATSVLFNQCLFNANSSQIAGGAIALYNTSSIQVENAAFWDNSSGYGGAVVSYNSSPSFTKTIFKTNKATTNGGAVLALQGSTTFSKSGFDRNSSGQLGGAVYQEQANTVVSQVVFTGNTAGKSGGAIYQLQANSQVLNSTLFGNTASVSGGAIALATASSTIAQNSIFWKNKQASQTNVAGADIAALSGSGSITAQYNILQPGSSVPADNGGTISNNLRGTDPMFTNEALPAGPDGWLGYGTDGLELKPGSPAINAGSNTLAASLLTDAKDNARIICSTIDLGPVEYQTCTGLITKNDPRLPKAPTVTGIKASVTNPFSSQLLIRYTGADKAEADISSLSGQKMWKGTVINKGQTQVNTATWASGLYQVTIRSNSGQPMVFKVIKVR